MTRHIPPKKAWDRCLLGMRHTFEEQEVIPEVSTYVSEKFQWVHPCKSWYPWGIRPWEFSVVYPWRALKIETGVEVTRAQNREDSPVGRKQSELTKSNIKLCFFINPGPDVQWLRYLRRIKVISQSDMEWRSNEPQRRNSKETGILLWKPAHFCLLLSDFGQLVEMTSFNFFIREKAITKYLVALEGGWNKKMHVKVLPRWHKK